MFAKLFLKLRFALIVSGSGRANFLKRRSLLRFMGDDILFQPRRLPNDPNLIGFGSNIAVASGVTFVAHDVVHRVLNVKNGSRLRPHEDCIHVLDNVFIGSNSTILPNVRIGPNAIVAAGAVVVDDVPEGAIVGGVPARVIGDFSSLESRRLSELRVFDGMGREQIDDALWERFMSSRDSG